MKVKTHKHKLLIPVFAVAITSLIGATFAFYSDRASYNNSLQLAADTATFVDTFDAPEDWTPCTETPKTATATNTNEEERWVRMKIDEYWRTADSQTSADDHTTSDLPLSWTDDSGTHRYTIINAQNTEAWARGDDGWFYYRTALAKDETTLSYLESVTFNCEVNLAGEVRYSVDGKTAESIPSDYANAQYHVYVTFEMTNHEYEYDELPENIVARIERTQKLYGSIMAAEAKAEAGDTITLLTDTEETVTNEKQVTLDLNNHTVTGSLTNTPAGNLTLINGEINNPNGVAVINNGTLTLGINDYDPDTGVANILNDNVRLVGTTTGLQQSEEYAYKFYYYDGYLEGDVGMVGGYDGAPMYHDIGDSKDVYFWPYVYQRQTAEQHGYQHIELRAADNAVSKTSIHGDIYYMNLQDNINTSVTTGYKIYAVRDFPASYAITSPANSTIVFDTVGYNINMNENITINGNFTIEDSASTVDETTGAVTYAGAISTQQTITGSGNLALKNVKVQNAVNTNNLTALSGKLTMRGATLSTKTSYAIVAVSGATYDVDNTSYIKVDTTSGDWYRYSAIYNATSDFIWNTGGNISSPSALINENGASATINGGNWIGSRTGIYNKGNNTVTVGGGYIYGWEYGISTGGITINGGVVASERAAVYANRSDSVTLNGGEIRAYSSNRYSAYGIQAGGGANIAVNGGTIRASSNNTAYGIYTIGSYYYGDTYVTVTGNDTIIEALPVNSTGSGYGVYADGYTVTKIESGHVYGNIYGAYTSNANYPIIIGKNDSDTSKNLPIITGEEYGIYGSAFKFFDGTLRGNTGAYPDRNIIQAVADGTSVHDDTGSEYTYEAWLVEGDNYLAVGDQEFNSLTKAYNAITGDSGTVKVIKDATINSTLPASPTDKSIIFDLNDHSITYAQPLTVSAGSTMTIVDNGPNHTGALHNSASTNFTVANSGILNIQSGLIDNDNRTIYNNGQDAKLNISGGTIKCANTCIYNTSPNSNHPSIVNLSGGEIVIDAASNSEQFGIFNYDNTYVNITGGQIRITRTSGNGTVYGIKAQTNQGGTTVIDAGDGNTPILVNTSAGTVYGVWDHDAELKSGIINVTGSDNGVYGFWDQGTFTMRSGKIIVNNLSTSTSAKTYGFQTNGNPSIYGGEIDVNAKAGSAYGGHNGSIYSGFPVTAGNISAVSEDGKGYGLYIGNSASKITGGRIYGSSYGLYSEGTRHTKTIGANGTEAPSITTPEIIGEEYALYGNYFYFYDGVLRGEKAYQAGVISAIPDGTSLHIESSADYDENCWLEQSIDYLQVGDTTFNSLSAAYGAITGSTGTITVIADVTVEATQPAFPSGKNITLDLNGHQLTYTQTLPISGTNRTLNIVDNSTDHDGRLNNSNGNNATIYVENGGTLNIYSGTVSSNSTAITVVYDYPNRSALNIYGGSIECQTTCIDAGYNTDISMTGGTVVAVDAGTSEQKLYTGDGVFNMTGGQLRIVRAANSANTADAFGFYSVGHVTINKTGSEPALYIDTPGANATGFYASIFTLQNGIININANNAYGTNTRWEENYIINGGEFIVNGITNAYGISNGRPTINNATITATAQNGNAYGIYFGSYFVVSRTYWSIVTMNNGTVTATSQNGNAYGAYGRMSEGQEPTLNLTGGSISSSAPNGLSYGGFCETTSILFNLAGGELAGNDYGIYCQTEDRIILGTDDSTLSDTAPIITGGEYGIYRAKIYFYDGKVKGTLSAFNDIRNIKAIPADASMKISSETIGSNTYDVRSLIAAHNVAQIGTTGYPRLDVAITAANAGDTIELLEDNYLFYNLTIPAEKDITIDTMGFNIITGNPITNNGKVVLTNSQYATLNPAIDYKESSYFITNTAGADLTIENLNINAVVNGVSNAGTLTLDHTSVTATNTAVSATGDVAMQNNSALHATSYVLYNDGGTTNVTGTTTTSGVLYNNSGSFTVQNSTVSVNGTSSLNYLAYNASGATMTVNDTTITATGAHSQMDEMVYNAGTIDFTDSSLSYISSGDLYNQYAFHNTGTATSDGTDFNLNRSTASYSYKGVGIYNPSGTFTMTTGSVTVNGYWNNAVGIQDDNGTITLGAAEPSSSPHYGTADADVSTTDPDIRASGRSSGIGVSFSNGHFNFYDGILRGSSAAVNKDPSVTEHLFEIVRGSDSDGYYMIQEFLN